MPDIILYPDKDHMEVKPSLIVNIEFCLWVLEPNIEVTIDPQGSKEWDDEYRWLASVY